MKRIIQVLAIALLALAVVQCKSTSKGKGSSPQDGSGQNTPPLDTPADQASWLKQLSDKYLNSEVCKEKNLYPEICSLAGKLASATDKQLADAIKAANQKSDELKKAINDFNANSTDQEKAGLFIIVAGGLVTAGGVVGSVYNVATYKRAYNANVKAMKKFYTPPTDTPGATELKPHLERISKAIGPLHNQIAESKARAIEVFNNGKVPDKGFYETELTNALKRNGLSKQQPLTDFEKFAYIDALQNQLHVSNSNYDLTGAAAARQDLAVNIDEDVFKASNRWNANIRNNKEIYRYVYAQNRTVVENAPKMKKSMVGWKSLAGIIAGSVLAGVGGIVYATGGAKPPEEGAGGVELKEETTKEETKKEETKKEETKKEETTKEETKKEDDERVYGKNDTDDPRGVPTEKDNEETALYLNGLNDVWNAMPASHSN